jgi:hypothetical protein
VARIYPSLGLVREGIRNAGVRLDVAMRYHNLALCNRDARDVLYIFSVSDTGFGL